MDSTLQFFKEEANRIRQSQIDNFYLNPTYPPNIPIKTFFNLFNIIHKSNDNDLILGFCFSIGPYVSSNRSTIKDKYSHEIWTSLVTFSEIINEPIQIFGFCEGVLTTSFCCLSIDESFLNFLIDEKPLKSKNLKPSLLISLYSDFQLDFIPFHSKSLMPLITDYFVNSIPIHSILNVYLVNALKYRGEEYKNYPNFEKNFYTSLYNVICTDSTYYRTLISPLFKFRKINENFFNCSNEFITNKINEIEKNSYEKVNMNRLLNLAYLMPFFPTDDVEKFMNKIIPIVSLYIVYVKKMPKELTEVLNESKKLLGIYSVAMKLYSILSSFLDTEFYPAVIYFLSIFLNAFKSHHPQCYNAIIDKFAKGLESTYPIKFPLAFAFYENSESIKAMIRNEKGESHHCCCSHHHNHQNTNSNDDHHNHEEKCECSHHHSHQNANSNDDHHNHEEKCECSHHQNHHDLTNDNDNSCENCCNHHDLTNDNDNSCENCCNHHDHTNDNDNSCENCCNHHDHTSSINDDHKCCHHCNECSENCEDKQFCYLILKNRVIPALFKIANARNGSDSHWAFKTLRSLLSVNSIDLFPSISELFSIYSIKIDTDLSNESFIIIQHHFYKYLFDYINVVQSSDEKQLLNEIIEFVIGQLTFVDSNHLEKLKRQGSSFCLLIENDLVNLICALCSVDSCCVNKFFEFGMSLSKELLFSGYFKSYSTAIKFVSLFYKQNKSKNDKQFLNQIQPFIEQAFKIGRGEIHSNSSIQIEVVSTLLDFDFIKFSDFSSIVDVFIAENDQEAKYAFNLAALQIIEKFLKRLVIEDKQLSASFESIVSPYIKSVYNLLRSSRSEKVVNKTFSIFTIILDAFLNEKGSKKSDKKNDFELKGDKKLTDYFEDVIMVTLFGRIRLFDHSMCYNYGFLSARFKFFSFASHFIAKCPKSPVSKRLTDDFSLWILRVSSEVVCKLLKVLEISLVMKIIDSEMIEFLSAAVMSRINEDNWDINLVSSSVSFLLKLKQKFPTVFAVDSFLTCLEKAWEENQDDNPEIVNFLIPVFLQTFSEKSFNISGDFLVFQDISRIIAAQSFDLNYPEILNYYIQMYQNKVPFDSFEKCASIVFTTFLTKNKKVLVDLGFNNEMLKTMHMDLKQIFKNNKSVERFVDNYFANNSIVTNRIKAIKKSPKLPEF